MKIRLFNQEKEFKNHLDFFTKKDVSSYSPENLKHKTTQILIKKPFFTLDVSPFFDYKIFPEKILIPYTQWHHEQRQMVVGDMIVQQIHLPPFITLSQKIVAAVKITSVTNTDVVKEFSYETIEGHVERGISTFRLQPKGDYSIFTIETLSEPAIPFLKIFAPISSLYQDYCTRQALENVEKIL